MTLILGIDNVCYTHTMRSGQMDLLGFLDRATKYGAAVVQMDPLWPSQKLELSESCLDYLHGLLKDRGLQIVVKGNSGGLGTLANPPEKAGNDLELFKSKIEAAAKLGSPVVRVVTRAYPYPTKHTQPSKGISRDQVIDWVIHSLKELTPLAENLGIRIAVENHGDLRIAEMERILAEVNSASLGIQYDLLEQVAIFEDPFMAAERLLSSAFTVHWNDAYPILSSSGFSVKPCMPGEGILKLDEVFNMIVVLSREIFCFTAFQADSMETEDQLVYAYLVDLKERLRSHQTPEQS
jgi:sugar phosphate isomerase/epimerase